MVTIKDIAKEAGVSHGTVSNVLNKTGKVRLKKIRLVEKAAEKLGYTPNTQAQLLRQGTKNLIAVLLPSLDICSYRDMFQVIQHKFTDAEYDITLYTTNGIIAKELSILANLPLAHMAAVFMMTCVPELPENFNPTCPVVFFNKIPKHSCSVFYEFSFDYKQAGKEISKKIIHLHPKSIAIIDDGVNIPNSNELATTIHSELEQTSIAITTITCTAALSTRAAFDALNNPSPFDIIITLKQDYAHAIHIASAYTNQKPHLITLYSYRTFADSGFEIYDLNYKMLANSASELILKFLATNNIGTKTIKYPCRGFRNQIIQKKTENKNKLRILTIENSSTAALKKLLDTYYIKTGIEVIVNVLPYDDLYTLLSMGGDNFHDLIRIDVLLLQEMGEKILLPLSKIKNDILGELIPEALKVHTLVKDTVYALPFDPSSEILLYRQDLFEDAVLKRQYYEKHHEALTIPTDFEQFNRIAAFFTQSLNPSSPTQYGTTLTYGAASVASCDFLPRLLYTNPEFVCDDGRILIDTPTNLSALNNYLETLQYTEKKENKWWSDSASEFAQGKIAMLIIFSNYTAKILTDTNSSVIGKTGIAPVPGDTPLLGGGVIGISNKTKNVDACFDFLKWFYQRDTACEFTYLGGLSPHRAVYENWDIMHNFPWITELQRGLKNGMRSISRANKSTTLPLKQFEYILGTAVKNAITQVMTPKQSLEFAQFLFDDYWKGLK